MRLKWIDCPVCGSGDHRPLRLLNGYQIVHCVGCSLSYINPRPDEAAILRAYTGASKGEALSFAHGYERSGPVEQDYSWCGEYVLDRLIGQKSGTSKGVRFLDIGAGQGWIVLEALKRGLDAFGYEFGDGRAFDGDDRLKSKIYRTEEQAGADGRKYDILFLSAVLEHVYRPVDFLRHWMSFLEDDGVFCVAAIPNLESIFIRTGLDGWVGNLPPAHLNYFSPSTLKSTIEKAGGQLTDLYTLGVPITLSPLNLFRQKKFEKPFLEDRGPVRDAIQTARQRSASASGAGTRRALTAAANHAIRWTGAGANLYATFRKKEGR